MAFSILISTHKAVTDQFCQWLNDELNSTGPAVQSRRAPLIQSVSLSSFTVHWESSLDIIMLTIGALSRSGCDKQPLRLSNWVTASPPPPHKKQPKIKHCGRNKTDKNRLKRPPHVDTQTHCDTHISKWFPNIISSSRGEGGTRT